MSRQKKMLTIEVDHVSLNGELSIPEDALGLVIFSHGSGSSRFSPRNNFVAQQLHKKGLATFLVDLLTKKEEDVYSTRFNIELLSDRLIKITQCLIKRDDVKPLHIGYFGASTGAASALVAAASLKNKIYAVVSRGGRPDMALDQLHQVTCPTLLLVGELDDEVLNLNRQAFQKIAGIKSLQIINHATHLFEEDGALEEVARLSSNWFVNYLPISKLKSGLQHRSLNIKAVNTYMLL